MTPLPSVRGGTIGVLVVHGIGDPPPAAALTDFTDALAGNGLATFDPELNVERLVDPSDSTERRLRFFPVTFRRGRAKPQSPGTEGTPIVAAEVFWGSASQLSPGRLGVLQGIVSLMVNVPALLVGANGGHKLSPGVVPWLTRIVSLLLSAPAFALNALLLATFASHVACAYLSVPAPVADRAVPWIAAGITTWLAWLPWIRFPETRWSFRLIGPYLLLSFLIYAAIRRSGSALPTTESFATCAVYALEAIVAIAAACQLAAVTWFAGRVLIRRRDPRLWTSVLATSLQLGIWTMVIPSVWNLLVKWMPAHANAPWIAPLFAGAAQSDGRQWPLVGMLAAVFLGVVIARWVHQWREVRRTAPLVAAATPCARLIIHPAVGVGLLVATTLGCVLIGAESIGLMFPHAAFPRAFAAALGFLEGIPKYQITTPLAVAVSLVVPQLRLGLDLVHDVISYLHYRCDVGEGVLRSYGRRKRYDPVRIRFDLALLHLVHTLKADRIVIVAHSQGSMMVFDELAHGLLNVQLPADLALVTFGSPVSHLYQHYFPELYPDWNHPHWQPFFGIVGRWINVYRLADYVGTTVQAPPMPAFTQGSLGAGGHTNYWIDPRLMTALADWKLLET